MKHATQSVPRKVVLCLMVISLPPKTIRFVPTEPLHLTTKTTNAIWVSCRLSSVPNQPTSVSMLSPVFFTAMNFLSTISFPAENLLLNLSEQQKIFPAITAEKIFLFTIYKQADPVLVRLRPYSPFQHLLFSPAAYTTFPDDKEVYHFLHQS